MKNVFTLKLVVHVGRLMSFEYIKESKSNKQVKSLDGPKHNDLFTQQSTYKYNQYV